MDLHRHDEGSSFDGFGKPSELAKIAKSLGHTALGISNHGNTNVLIQHYIACREVGIKPVLGVEGYFIPKYKPQNRGFHLCLFAMNHQGYRNINEIQFEGEKQKYYNPIWTFDILEEYSEGVICTSACVAGYLSQCIVKGNIALAKKAAIRFKEIFGDNFYIEIQPYTISEKGLQEKINVELIKLAKELDIKCILTSDSHRGLKEDLDTYLKMHEIAGHDLEHIESTYKERYMPSDKELMVRFYKMHRKDFGDDTAKKMAKEMIANLKEIEDKVDGDLLEGLKQELPKMGKDSGKVLVEKIKQGLKNRGKYNKKYIARVKEELDVIETLGFQDYFLIVADYVNWAKEQGIFVGPGRGSCCNCLIAYALGITDVDSVLFGLDFRRFLRKDKKKLPDIDIDFETSRRQEVIRYVVNKYPGHTARIASYGLYKVDNLINDLAKVCGLNTTGDVDSETKKENKEEIARIKKHINNFIFEGNLDTKRFLESSETKMYNSQYDNICKHFSKLFKKLRFIGTHAAGVAVTGGNILDYTSLRIDKLGDLYTNYDLNDLENVHVVKFDMLGLNTMESIGELRKMTGISFDESWVEDEAILKRFNKGDTSGIFQFDKNSVKDIMRKIDCDCFDDIVATNAMNRPGPLSMKQPELYANNKFNLEEAKESKVYEYTKESYGTLIYQEQIQKICVNIAGMSWGDADKVMKMIGGQSQSEDAVAEFERNKKELGDKFIQGAMDNGLTQEEAEEIWGMVLVYSFNKGHSVGYSLISVDEMYYKVYHPLEFWYVKLKYAINDEQFNKFNRLAVQDGVVIFLPHVNYSSERTRVRKVDGEKCLQQGLSEIKGVGEKAAAYIAEERRKNGIFTSYDDFYDRCKSRVVTSRVIDILKTQGALEFNKKRYVSRVTKYNSALFSRNS